MDDLLEQGITAYKAGNREEARKIFITVIKQSPDDERGWKWMYNVSTNVKEREHCLKQILRINPKNEKAGQRYKELTTSKPTPNTGRTAIKPIIIVGGALSILCSIICIGVLFISTNTITSTPTSEISLPIEKVIEMTSSAAGAQTAESYSPTPLSTATLAPTLTPQPVATLFILETPTQTQFLNTPVPVYSTNTPFVLPSPIVPTSGGGGGYDNNGDGKVTCADFKTQAAAQQAYNAGQTQLDGNDNDGKACESLP